MIWQTTKDRFERREKLHKRKCCAVRVSDIHGSDTESCSFKSNAMLEEMRPPRFLGQFRYATRSVGCGKRGTPSRGNSYPGGLEGEDRCDRRAGWVGRLGGWGRCLASFVMVRPLPDRCCLSSVRPLAGQLSLLQQLQPSLKEAGLSSRSLIWSGKSYGSTSDSCRCEHKVG